MKILLSAAYLPRGPPTSFIQPVFTYVAHVARGQLHYTHISQSGVSSNWKIFITQPINAILFWSILSTVGSIASGMLTMNILITQCYVYKDRLIDNTIFWPSKIEINVILSF